MDDTRLAAKHIHTQRVGSPAKFRYPGFDFADRRAKAVGFFSRWRKRRAQLTAVPPPLEPVVPFPTFEPAQPFPSYEPLDRFEAGQFKAPASERKSHIIVFANEKGGVGKSTTAFHTCVALCNAGHSVAALDVDLRQLTLDRALNARITSAREYEVELPGPSQILLAQSTEAELESKVRMSQIDCAFIVIDVGGHDSPIARRAIAMADTIVTPVNDSFIDLDMLGHVDPQTGELKTLGAFARLVEHLKEPGLARRERPLDWVVMQNRSRSLGTKNERKFLTALEGIAPVAGFRLVPGLRERVVYRELFPLGLTLFDLEQIPSLGSAQPAARKEIATMLESLKLPAPPVVVLPKDGEFLSFSA
jgi:chromosome partitioning protein